MSTEVTKGSTYADAYARLGSYNEVAKEYGVDESTVRRAVKRYARRNNTDPAILKAMSESGMEDTDALHSGWIKTEGASLYFKMPGENRTQDLTDRLREALGDIPRATPTIAPKATNADLLTVYPIADAHIGMLAWGVETGEDYDTRLASQRICSWMQRVVDASPPSDTALILDVGDLMHADDQTNMTPASGHLLDVDTRYFHTVDVTIWTMVQAIDTALTKHRKVIVSILKGNHDPHAYIAIMFALAAHYRDEPRIEVQKRPGDFLVIEWGECLISAHHGDKGKAERLVMFLADQYAQMWGRTRWRYLFTGHLHSHKSADVGGVVWEQLRALTARDHYAFSNAYVGRSQLSGITYSKTEGVKARVFVGA